MAMPEAHLSIPTTAWYGRRRQLLALVVASAMVIAFVVIWASLSAHWRSGVDFSSMYSAATLVREGGVRQIYNPQALARVGDRLMAPDHLILPFQEVALGAVGMVPLTVLRLADAFRVWTALQFLLVVASVVIAVRAAPVRLPLGALGLAAIAAIAMAGFGTEQLLSYGNWSGLNALGVAMAYRSWNRGSYAAGGAWLAGTAAIAKPHLAIGLLVFVIGWGNRRAILGAVAAGGTALIAFAALMGVEGLRSFLSTVSQDTTVWSPRGGTSIFALPSVWFNDGPMTQVVGIAGVCAALAVCFALGRRVRRERSLLGAGLAATAVLSLLAAPHGYLYDTVMLAPAVAWSLAELDLFGVHRRAIWATPWAVVALWAAATWIDRVLDLPLRPAVYVVGEFGVWATIGLAAALWLIPTRARLALDRRVLSTTAGASLVSHGRRPAPLT